MEIINVLVVTSICCLVGLFRMKKEQSVLFDKIDGMMNKNNKLIEQNNEIIRQNGELKALTTSYMNKNRFLSSRIDSIEKRMNFLEALIKKSDIKVDKSFGFKVKKEN